MPTIEQVHSHYQTFLSNPTIQRLMSIPKWTISDKDKRPISMYNLLYRNQVRGAQTDMPGDMLELPKLIEQFSMHFPGEGMISNFVFYLDVMVDDIVVLDIEPSCPSTLKREFLQLPYLYGETSLSGKGIHLVFPKPKNFDNFPAAAKKVAMKGPGKHYEILMNHWVTFTGRPLGHPVGKNPENQKPFELLYAKLAIKQKEAQTAELHLDAQRLKDDIAEIPDSDYIMDILLRPANDVRISVEQYDGDMSRYEFAYFGIKYSQLANLLSSTRIKKNGHTYTAEDYIHLLYAISVQQLPHRDKHDTVRQHMPWLLYEATQIVGQRASEKKK